MSPAIPLTGPPAGRVSSETLRRICLEEGADDVGFVEVDRPALAEERPGIERLFPRARTLIALTGRMNRHALRTTARNAANQEFHHTINDLTATARRILRRLEAMGIQGLAPTAGFPMDMDRLGDGRLWDISHKRVAEQAGLGRMGLHRNVIHPRLGNHILLETLLIDAEVDATGRPLEGTPCLTCNLCVSACPVGAIHKDGSFDFSACMTHNYREFFGGFQDWVETVTDSASAAGYRARVRDSETASVWQSLSFGANYKAAYCMAVCPAGGDILPEYHRDRKEYVRRVVRPLIEHPEPVYVQPGTPAEAAARKRVHKELRFVHNRLRPATVEGFLGGLPIAFNPRAARGYDFTLSFRFTGHTRREATVRIRNGTLEVREGASLKANLEITVDAETWIRIVNRQASPLWAVLTGRLQLRGNPIYLLKFQRAVPV